MDLLPPTAPSLVFARETYTPYIMLREPVAFGSFLSATGI